MQLHSTHPPPPRDQKTSFWSKTDISAEEHKLSGQQHVYLEPKFPVSKMLPVQSSTVLLWNLELVTTQPHLTFSSEESWPHFFFSQEVIPQYTMILHVSTLQAAACKFLALF